MLRSALSLSKVIKSKYLPINYLQFSTNAEHNSNTVTLIEHPYKLKGYLPYGKDPVKWESKNKLFAVVEFSGTQYKVTNDDTIVADKMDDIDIGQEITIDDVLLVGSRAATVLGRPTVAGAKVTAVVEEMARDKKVVILKVRRRKNSRNKKGFRRQVTVLRIKDIEVSNNEIMNELSAPVTNYSIKDTSDVNK